MKNNHKWTKDELLTKDELHKFLNRNSEYDLGKLKYLIIEEKRNFIDLMEFIYSVEYLLDHLFKLIIGMEISHDDAYLDAKESLITNLMLLVRMKDDIDPHIDNIKIIIDALEERSSKIDNEYVEIFGEDYLDEFDHWLLYNR